MNNNFLYNAYIYFNKLDVLDTSIKKDLKLEMTGNTFSNLQIIGIFDKVQKIWYNGWSIYNDEPWLVPSFKKSKEVLQYALNIEKDTGGLSQEEKIMIRSILTNSKFYINEKKTQLYVILAIVAYVTKAKKWGALNFGKLRYYYVEL
jgi:hypothetical protein